MDIDNLTIGEAKKLVEMFGSTQAKESNGIDFAIGQEVIIRTYSAGVWFGTLKQKAGSEVVLTCARRMWQWFAKDGISLSEVAMNGIARDKSKICVPAASVWLEAIEILPCTSVAIESIGGADNATP